MCDYQCTSVRFVKLSNRIESNYFSPNRNALLHSCNVLKRKADDQPQPSTWKCSTGPGPMKKYLMDTVENSLPAVLSRLAIKQSSMLMPSSSLTASSNAADRNMLSAVKAEMAVFQSIGKRGRCLEAVYYRYLLTVLPTSMEAETAFSAARLMCCKVRSRLDDSSVDTLFHMCHCAYQKAASVTCVSDYVVHRRRPL